MKLDGIGNCFQSIFYCISLAVDNTREKKKKSKENSKWIKDLNVKPEIINSSASSQEKQRHLLSQPELTNR